MASRKKIRSIELLAAALREIAGIPVDHAKLMSAEQMVSLFQFDHTILHAHGGADEHWNLTPMLIAPHREKTAKIDVPRYAKGERIRKEHEEFQRRLLTPRDERPPKKRTMQSRGFEKRREKKPWRT